MRDRLLATLLGAIATVAVLPSGTALADPAGPTDYRSEIAAIEPPTGGFTIEILGGDSFVLLTAEPGTTVEVPGYGAEPYLRFDADGTVLENRNAPTTYQNEERYGTDFPDFASPDAEPDWIEVGDDGSYAWHDHRAHWMQPIRPAGKQPGDQILEQVIPLVVDGRDVEVVVTSTWLPAPSRAPLLAGFVVAGAGLAVAELRRRSGGSIAPVAAPVAALALVVGWWQFRSFPAETGPRLLWWALPLVALVLSLVALAVSRRDRFWSATASMFGGALLVAWGMTKRDGLDAAIAATDAPDWLDRFAVTLSLLGGLGLAALGAWTVVGFLAGRPPVGPAAG